MNETDVDGIREPVSDQPKVDVTAEIEVPPEIYDRAERRAAAAGGDRAEYLLDHLMIEYDFTKGTSTETRQDADNAAAEIWQENLLQARNHLVKDDVDLSAAREQLAAAIEKIDQVQSQS